MTIPAGLVSTLLCAQTLISQAIDELFSSNILLLNGDYVSSSSATNSPILDSSVNNFSFTGTYPTQGSFSPFTSATVGYDPKSPSGSVAFDGSGDYLSVTGATGPAVTFGTNDFTIEGWFYFRNVSNIGYLYDGRPTASNGAFPSLSVSASGTIIYYVSSAARITSSVILANTWYHIALVRASGSTKLYINGVQSGATYTDSTNYINSNAEPGIGTSTFGRGTNTLNGYICDFHMVNGTALYTAAFTPPTAPIQPVSATVLLTCQYNGAKDNSTNAFGISISGYVQQTDNSPYVDTSYSNYFNGTDYLSTDANSATNIIGSATFNSTSTVTIEGWIYQTQRQTSYPCVIGDMDPSFSSVAFSFGPDSTGKLSALWYDGTVKTCTGTTIIPLNTWTHIAVSINSGAIKLFVNGNLETTVGISTLTNTTTNTGYITVGRFNNGGSASGFFGHISNLRIVKSALYSSTFTPSVSQLVSTASTSLLLCQSNRFIDRSGLENAITVGGSPKVLPYSPFTPYQSSWGSGSLYFDGSTDVQTQASSLTTLIGSSSVGAASTFTIEGWIYQTQRQTNSVPSMIGDMLPASGTNSFSFGPDNTGKLAVYWYQAGAKTCTGTTIIPLNTWTHIAVSINNGAIKLFVNGNLETVMGITTLTNTATGGGYLNLGGWNGGGAAYGFFGYISNLRVTRSALYSASFVTRTTPYPRDVGASLLLYGTNSRIVDYSKSCDLYSNNVTSSTSIKKYGTGSLQFNGTSSYLSGYGADIGKLGSSDFTIEMYVRFGSLSFTTFMSLLEVRDAVTTSAWSWTVGLRQPTTGVYNWQFSYTSNGNTAGGLSPSLISATPVINVWYHLAWVRQGNGLYIYVDGILAGSSTTFFAGSTTIWSPTTARLLTGAAGATPASFLNGYVDDLRITKAARYTANFTPPQRTFPTSP